MIPFSTTIACFKFGAQEISHFRDSAKKIRKEFQVKTFILTYQPCLYTPAAIVLSAQDQIKPPRQYELHELEDWNTLGER